MKRPLYLLLTLIVAAFGPCVLHAQVDLPGLIQDENNASVDDSIPPQRIGVPAPQNDEDGEGAAATPSTQMELSANQTGTIQGYCFDEYLIAPRRLTRFNHVLAGKNAEVRLADGRRMPLGDAVSSGLLDIRANQLSVRFTNRSGGSMAINFDQPIVLWDRPGGDVNPMALAALNSPEIEDYETRQAVIWRFTTAERLLGVLGYYEGSVWNIDRARMTDATREYQIANGLTPSGAIDGPTAISLGRAGENLQNQLNTLGFRDNEGRSLRTDLAAQVRAYERYLGRVPTGRWNADLASRLVVDQNVLPQIARFKPGASIAETMKGDVPTGLLTYLNGSNSLLMLAQTPAGLELWSRRGRSVRFAARDAEAVQQMDDAAAALAGRAETRGRVVVYPRASSGDVARVFVAGRTVNVDRRSLNAFMNGGSVPAELAAALNPGLPAAAEETGRRNPGTIIVYRGPFVQGRGAESGPGTEALALFGMQQPDARVLAKALDRSYGDRAVVYISDDLRVGASKLSSTSLDHGGLERIPRQASRLALAR